MSLSSFSQEAADGLVLKNYEFMIGRITHGALLWSSCSGNPPEEAIKRGFVEAPDKQNRYHRNKGQSGNKKYYHPITGQEVIFDENGKIVTLPENTGTKNYGADPVSPGHVIYDVLPYWIWGNSEKDTTPFWDRVWGSGK